MNEESVFIDLDKEVDEKTVKEAELSANAAVWENHPITLHYVPYTELGKYGLRKKNDKLRGIVRLVDIKEGDCRRQCTFREGVEGTCHFRLPGPAGEGP